MCEDLEKCNSVVDICLLKLLILVVHTCIGQVMTNVYAEGHSDFVL